jgi:PadR family transcriptional regulator, regulatory protein AphA
MTLQFAILGLLTYAPMNGYYLKKIFSSSVNYFWTASLSQIYRELAVLEKKGYVVSSIQEQDDRPDKRIYTLTEAGEKAFSDWLINFPDELVTPKRDEFSLRIFFGSRLGKERLKKQFERFVEERKNFNTIMSENKNMINDAVKKISYAQPTEDFCIRFVAKRALMTNQVLIQWAEDCIKELDQIEI